LRLGTGGTSVGGTEALAFNVRLSVALLTRSGIDKTSDANKESSDLLSSVEAEG